MNNTIRKSDGRLLSGLFFRVMAPQVFLLLLNGINNLVDGLVGANFLGADVMAAIGVYAPFQMIWLAVGSILTVSSQVLSARYMGAGNLPKTRGLFSLTITLSVTVNAFAMLLSFTLSVPLARILGASPDKLGDISTYIIGRGVGLIPMVLGSQMGTFLALEGQDKRIYVSTGILLTVNIALDLLFTAVLKMGIMGLGVSTSLSQWLSLIAAGTFFLTPKASLKYNFKSIDWKEIWGMLKIGFPSAMVLFLTAFRASIFNNLLTGYDPTMIAIAAMSTYTMTMMIFESVGKGVATTGRLLTSVSYGEGDDRSIIALMKMVFTKGMIITLAASGLTFLLADPVTHLFYASPASEVFQMTARGLRVGAGILILETIAAAFSNFYSAIGRNVMVNVMSVLEGIGAMLPFGLLLIPKMGFDGVMITFLIGYAIVALCGPVYAILYWKRVPKTLREWLTIPENFGVPAEERMDASIHSLEDATRTSEEVSRFCAERKIDPKKAAYSALALEELCLGIIKDRFEEKDGKKTKHTIELCVVHKGEDVFMSVKDDCRPFNPKERADLVNPQDDSPKSISIRLFMGIVKDTEYQLTLGMNVFTMTI